MKTILGLALVGLVIGGCAVYAAPVPGPGVYIAPAPVVVAPGPAYVGWGWHGYWRGGSHRRWN
jgi:hypothetical protein